MTDTTFLSKRCGDCVYICDGTHYEEGDRNRPLVFFACTRFPPSIIPPAADIHCAEYPLTTEVQIACGEFQQDPEMV